MKLKLRVFQILIPVLIVLVFLTFLLYENPSVRVPATPELNSVQTWIGPAGIFPNDTNPAVGQGSAVDIDSQGNIYFLHRAGYGFGNSQIIASDTVWVISSDSHEVLNTWGANLFKSPHGITIDSNDNVWITDVMQNKVYQFDHDGQLLRSYGKDYPFYMESCLKIRNILRRLPCFINDDYFARPTDIEIMDDGSFIVSDGYRNSRIVKFDMDGGIVWEIDAFGNKNSEFNLPHGLAMDSSNNIYVADRKNARIQIFDNGGNWLNTWDAPELGRPYGLDIGYDDNLYIVDAGDADEIPGGISRSQIIKVSLQGEVISRYSGFGSNLGEMDLPHDIAVDTDGKIYVAEINNNRIQYFVQNQSIFIGNL